MRLRVGVLLGLVGSVVVLAGCGGGGDATPEGDESPAATTAAPAAPAPSSVIPTAVRDAVIEVVEQHWNDCDPDDVCVPDQPAITIDCEQPNPQVTALECFVTTSTASDGTSSGYFVDVEFSSDLSEYTWMLRQP